MYLPTDMKTIYNVMINSERKTREFWRTLPNQDKVTRSAVEQCNGRIWALSDLRRGIYIV